MSEEPRINNFQSQISQEPKSLVEIAKSERLDEFVEVKRIKESTVEYSTVHGWRIKASDRPKDNLFFVVEDRAGFARGNPIPYELHYTWELLTHEEITAANQLEELTDIPMLIVNFVLPQEPAAEAGYAQAVDLPYYFQRDGFFDMSILIVDLGDKHEAKAAGYDKAIPLPYSRYLPDLEFNRLRKLRDRSFIPSAIYAAYGKATQLPDEASLRFQSACCFTICLPNSLDVCINSRNEEATSVGYANAVPVPNISSESVSELAQLFRLTPVFDCILSVAEREGDRITIMFSKMSVAREVAYTLRGIWDRLNSVDIYQPDWAAIQNALALVKLELGLTEVEYCTTGECCLLENRGEMRIFGSARAGKSVMLASYFVDDLSLA